MPQENYPFTITTSDSTYTIRSETELLSLPDSIQQLLSKTNQLPATASTEERPAYDNPQSNVSPGFLVGAMILFGIVLYKAIQAKHQLEEEEEKKAEEAAIYIPQCLVYKGEELDFTNEELHNVCSRYNPFYNKLSERKQDVFINRLKGFMFRKDFYIISSQGYKEMLILISAAAIQISYGLDDYLFPYFSRIIIHPEEYIAYDPLRILVGNVQGKSITLSWKHFLEDYENPSDGKNVGLHEMAHALQVQHLFQNYGYRSEFKEEYEHYDKIDDEILLAEKTNSSKLFDENALKNPNEFWATSVELFFEKPQQLKTQYPQLYQSICMLLNLDTAAM